MKAAVAEKPVYSKTHPAYRYRKAGKGDLNPSINSDGVGYVSKRFETAEEEAEAEALEEGQQWFNNTLLKAEKPGGPSIADVSADFVAEITRLKDELAALKMANLNLGQMNQSLQAELESLKPAPTAKSKK